MTRNSKFYFVWCKNNKSKSEMMNQTAIKSSDNKDIPGLYAAGRTAVGVCSNIYVSGLSIADCIFSGRRAGFNVSESN